MTKHDQQQRRNELIRDIRAVAVEIGYTGRGDTARFAEELDNRGIKSLPLIGRAWRHRRTTSQWSSMYDQGVKLRRYLKENLPELLKNGASGLQTPKCLCSQCPLQGQAGCERKQAPVAVPKPEPLSNPSVRDKPLETLEMLETPVRDEVLETVRPRQSGSAANLGGWSVRQNKRGHFYGYKRMNGKLRSVYLGKSLDGAEEKLGAAAIRRFDQTDQENAISQVLRER